MSPVIAEEVVPALHNMQQEPAWLFNLANSQPYDWRGSVPPPDCHQDLLYLTTDNQLSSKSAQASHSFYSIMLVF